MGDDAFAQQLDPQFMQEALAHAVKKLGGTMLITPQDDLDIDDGTITFRILENDTYEFRFYRRDQIGHA